MERRSENFELEIGQGMDSEGSWDLKAAARFLFNVDCRMTVGLPAAPPLCCPVAPDSPLVVWCIWLAACAAATATALRPLNWPVYESISEYTLSFMLSWFISSTVSRTCRMRSDLTSAQSARSISSSSPLNDSIASESDEDDEVDDMLDIMLTWWA